MMTFKLKQLAMAALAKSEWVGAAAAGARFVDGMQEKPKSTTGEAKENAA